MTADRSEKRSRGTRVAPPDGTPVIAESLARIGWPVFPVSIYEDADGKRHKVPAVKWKDEATTDVATVREWWEGEHAGRWIGVYAGAAGIVVGDVDPGGYDAIDEAGHVLPKTFVYPSHRPNSFHHVYAAPEGIDLTIAKGIVPHVDVRAGSGLMVYYGPALTKRPKLAPAPDWLIIERGVSTSAGSSEDRAPSADETAFRARAVGGSPDKKVRKALARVTGDGMGHDDMLSVVTELITLGRDGHPGIAAALDAARETYASGWPDAGRHWDNAVAGSIRRLGLPPKTYELTKTQRKAIAERNRPEAVEAKKAERKATFRAEKHQEVMSRDVAVDRPDAGDRVLEDSTLAPELAGVLRGQWAYADGFGIMRWHRVGETGGQWKVAQEHSLIEAVRLLLIDVEIDEHTVAALRGDNKAIDRARTLLSRGRAASVARLIVGILAEDAPEFDAHPDLLNTPTGVVDLRTGELTPADPALYMTKMTGASYDPDADMTMWERACEALPEKVVDYLQVRMGQGATGYMPDDDVLVIFEGAGENGKTAWLAGYRQTLGDYARKLPDRLLVGDPGDHPTTLMSLQGVRAGVIEELPEGRELNVKRLKDIIGQPEITARRMKQDDTTFTNTTSPFLATNYLPIVAETDHGTWRRLMLVRFVLTFLKPSKYDRLKKANALSKRHRRGDVRIKRHFERTPDAGMLRWIVEGAKRWYAAEMISPEAPRVIERDTDAWRLEADPILAYTTERLTRDEGFAITASDLVADFNHWLEKRGRKAWSNQTINSRFQGHVTMDGIARKSVKWSMKLRPSRPRSIYSTTPIPRTTTAWRGVRFVEETAETTLTQAQQDAMVIADMEKSL